MNVAKQLQEFNYLDMFK